MHPLDCPRDLLTKSLSFKINTTSLDFTNPIIWGNDNYKNGFSDILSHEKLLTENDKNGGITLQVVKQVASWGRLRNPSRIEGKEIVLPAGALRETDTTPSHLLALRPLEPLRLLENNIYKGIGPTYSSKVLRFGLPKEYGAIDTRCVRVFGQGDQLSQQHHWLELRARNDGYGWYISKAQKAWPFSYAKWINILRFFSQQLPDNCPHPPAFVQSSLRVHNKWACADVEMAFFTYASQFTT